jgi:hypothetical protein
MGAAGFEPATSRVRSERAAPGATGEVGSVTAPRWCRHAAVGGWDHLELRRMAAIVELLLGLLVEVFRELQQWWLGRLRLRVAYAPPSLTCSLSDPADLAVLVAACAWRAGSSPRGPARSSSRAPPRATTTRWPPASARTHTASTTRSGRAASAATDSRCSTPNCACTASIGSAWPRRGHAGAGARPHQRRRHHDRRAGGRPHPRRGPARLGPGPCPGSPRRDPRSDANRQPGRRAGLRARALVRRRPPGALPARAGGGGAGGTPRR